MKKKMVMMVCSMAALVMAVSMMGCGKKTTADQAGTEISEDGAAQDAEASEGENTQIPNPFVDCETMADAEKLAGFDLVAPEQIEGYEKELIQAIDGELIQVFYVNPENEEDEILIRKGVGSDDISGNYEDFTEVSTAAAGDLEVTLKGNDGKVTVAVWATGSYTFSIQVDAGASQDEMLSLVEAVQ